MKYNKNLSYYCGKILYQFVFIPLLQLFFLIAQYFSNKIKKGYVGRKQTFNLLKQGLATNTQPVLWLHAASFGEYKQGLSVIAEWRKQCPNFYILVSFFSPSGYEAALNESVADLIFYLPFDTKKNAQQLISIIRPRVVIFTKYDLWSQLIFALKKNNTPIFLVSAIFSANHFYFKSFFSYFQNSLRLLNGIFVQDQKSENLLKKIGISEKVYILGDTRFDTMQLTVNLEWKDVLIEKFIQNNKVLIAGSIYYNDLEMLKPVLEKYSFYKFILVPHQLDEPNLISMKKQVPQALFYSDVTKNESLNGQILILNTMGMLDKIYRYADVVYIGGGLDKTGIHNIVEPIAYHKPTIIGPNYVAYKEAVDLVHLKAVQVIKNSQDFINIFENLEHHEQRKIEIKQINKNYFDQHCQVANKVVKIIKDNLSL